VRARSYFWLSAPPLTFDSFASGDRPAALIQTCFASPPSPSIDGVSAGEYTENRLSSVTGLLAVLSEQPDDDEEGNAGRVFPR